VVQPIEKIGSKWVVHGLDNVLVRFPDGSPEETQDATITRFTFTKAGGACRVSKVELFVDLPTELSRSGRGPRWADRPQGLMRRIAGTAAVTVAAFAVVFGLGAGLGRLSYEDKMAIRPNPVTPGTPGPGRGVTHTKARPLTGLPPLPLDEQGPWGARRSTGTREVALTFDDGPDPGSTPEVLALLRQFHVKATFCVIGIYAVEFPQVVRQIVAEGHTLCNHSWKHDMGLGSREKAAILDDLTRTNNAISAAAPHARISYYRQPGGLWTPTLVQSARQLGMTPLHWAVDPQDWRKPGSQAIVNAVTSATRPGSIVLLHDAGGDRRGTLDALRTILPNLTARFSLVALPPGADPPRLLGVRSTLDSCDCC
jgi:peptidoglycan-N-acetylglucosamine deacetylase